MPQLSLYIDQATLKKLETAAKLEHLTISKYVVKKLSEAMFHAWPAEFETLYGSIEDESFNLDKPLAFQDDAAREAL